MPPEKPRPYFMFNTVLLIYALHSVQIGIGILGFQRYVYQHAGHDSWISVILAGCLLSFILWIMVKTLRIFDYYDLFLIHYTVFGRWIGRLLNALYVGYLLLAPFIVIMNYIDMVQTWIFLDMPNWVLSLLILLLVAYGVTGGIRTVVGFAYLAVILTLWLIPLVFFASPYLFWNHLLPIGEHSLNEILLGTKSMSFSLLGFELLYFMYPFIKGKKKVSRYVQWASLSITCMYLLVMVVTLAFFSGPQLMRNNWATFAMYKIVQLPFLERFEYIAVCLWLLIVLPNIMLYFWAAIRGMKCVFTFTENQSLSICLVLIFSLCLLFRTRNQIESISNIMATIGIIVAFAYPLFLFTWVFIREKWLKKGGNQHETSNS
ncbi:spore germination protein [Brevibacillus laterosporus]|uniref:Spore germination protein n=1 Tax=Brevibacillus halotolerans TaxID=1507437 RepID=A0ABT4HR61_9BACL|nr:MULTISPECIES: spore germination protein [Brevibacillus]MCR8983573.1 spore germination protein [Brevibacillus laterosporus]MCZ0829291.1 spore germination protein [Brevibacillus halotolerans]